MHNQIRGSHQLPSIRNRPIYAKLREVAQLTLVRALVSSFLGGFQQEKRLTAKKDEKYRPAAG